MDINAGALSSTDPPFFYSSTGQPKNGTHHRNALRCWICSSLAFLVLAPVISIMLGLHLHARDFRYVPDGDIVPFNGRTLRMEAVLIGADPFAGSMTMDWTIAGEEKSLCNEQNLGACTDVNIFFDKYVRLQFLSSCVHRRCAATS
jgi:hypothetical protein